MDDRRFLANIEREMLFQALDELDHVSGLRNTLSQCTEDPAGLPMPIPGMPLELHPRVDSEFRALVGRLERDVDATPPVPLPPQHHRRNIFWSTRKRGYVHLWSEGGELGKGGSLRWRLVKAATRFDLERRTLQAAFVWGGRQEWKANEKLCDKIGIERFKDYAMTGAFEEQSLRSGLTYLFRRLKPTVVLSRRTGEEKILTCLCLHPLGYYKRSFAGALVPTDDVLAHLTLMRTDEPYLWRAANHHPPDRPESGI